MPREDAEGVEDDLIKRLSKNVTQFSNGRKNLLVEDNIQFSQAIFLYRTGPRALDEDCADIIPLLEKYSSTILEC